MPEPYASKVLSDFLNFILGLILLCFLKQKKPPFAKRPFLLGDPGETRTPNPQSRNLIFYPIELRNHFGLQT